MNEYPRSVNAFFWSRLLLAPTVAVFASGYVQDARADAPYNPKVAACAQVAVPPQLSPGEVPGVMIPAGQIEAAVAKVDGLAQSLMKLGIPGMAVAVVYNGRTVFAKGYGVRSVDTGVAVDADTVFQLASLSKSVGATVVAHQVGRAASQSQGASGLRWDTPINTLMPSFKLSDAYVSGHVTVADFYAHRSGLPEHAADLLEDMGYTRAQVLERLRHLPLAPFRSTYAYTNFGLTAAAEAVAIAAGTDWATLSQRAIYDPLGMASTSSRYADFLGRSNRAVGHINADGKYRVTPRARNPDHQSAAGGVSSSVTDMARWMAMVLNRGRANDKVIVNDCALLPAISPQIVSSVQATAQSRTGFYGYGFIVGNSAAGRVVMSHSGAFSLGAATAYTMIPSANIGIVTLTNAAPMGLPETLNAEFADLVQMGFITQDWKSLYAKGFAGMNAPTGALVGKQAPSPAEPARALSAYVGTYGNDYYGSATVSLVNGALSLSLGPAGLKFPLGHWNGDVFIFVPPGESAPDGSISMLKFGDGTLTIEYLNNEYSGTFERNGAAPAR